MRTKRAQKPKMGQKVQGARAWCSEGHWVAISDMARNKSKPHGLDTYCRPCASKRNVRNVRLRGIVGRTFGLSRCLGITLTMPRKGNYAAEVLLSTGETVMAQLRKLPGKRDMRPGEIVKVRRRLRTPANKRHHDATTTPPRQKWPGISRRKKLSACSFCTGSTGRQTTGSTSGAR